MSQGNGGQGRGARFRKEAAAAAERAMPFEPLVPNEQTSAAMREARTGRLPRFKKAKDLLQELHEGD